MVVWETKVAMNVASEAIIAVATPLGCPTSRSGGRPAEDPPPGCAGSGATVVLSCDIIG